jgi:hypothetical protein
MNCYNNFSSDEPSNPFNRSKIQAILFVVDLCVDIFFFCDIVVNFRTTYIGKNDALVTDPKKIAIRYLRTYFIVDLVAAVPWDLIATPALEVIFSYCFVMESIFFEALRNVYGMARSISQ